MTKKQENTEDEEVVEETEISSNHESLFKALQELMAADGEISDEEEQLFAQLKQLLSNDSEQPKKSQIRGILTSMSKIDGKADFEESTIIKEYLESLPDEMSDDSDIHEEIPDSTRDLEIDGDAHMWIRDLDLHYGNAQAIYNVSIPFKRNSVTALIGPSGCGKSTLLRCLNRMNDLISICKVDGSVELDGEEIMGRSADLVTIRRRVGMVFQKPNPFPKSIYDNVAYGVRLHYTPSRRELDKIVEESLRRAAIWDEVNDRLHELGTSLSGGQQQRLCIARTIAVEPEVILMDEPCSALDPISTLKIEETMHELKKNYTIIIVTHNMQQALRVSDMTAFFNAIEYEDGDGGKVGYLAEFNSTKKIFSSPKEKTTQEYISGKFG